MELNPGAYILNGQIPVLLFDTRDPRAVAVLTPEGTIYMYDRKMAAKEGREAWKRLPLDKFQIQAGEIHTTPGMPWALEVGNGAFMLDQYLVIWTRGEWDARVDSMRPDQSPILRAAFRGIAHMIVPVEHVTIHLHVMKQAEPAAA